MLDEICSHIRNYFIEAVHSGKYEIKNGSIVPLDFLKDGQYFRIVGSTFNDGVYQYPATELTDEVFSGSVWAMAVPPTFIALADEIKAFNESDEAKPTAYTSESFGGYAYTKATDANGVGAGWETVFAKRLNKWRKARII